MNRIAQTTSTDAAVSGGLLVDFDSVLGEDRQPFARTQLGATVTATVTVRFIRILNAGHARGIVDGDGGWAFFYIPRDYIARVAGIVKPGAKVKVRGVHALFGTIPSLSIIAAREVTV